MNTSEPQLSSLPTANEAYSPQVCTFPGCGKVFDRGYNLRVHQRKHTGEQPYKCTVPGCDKTFKWRSSSAHHKRLHTLKGDMVPVVQPLMRKRNSNSASTSSVKKVKKTFQNMSSQVHVAVPTTTPTLQDLKFVQQLQLSPMSVVDSIPLNSASVSGILGFQTLKQQTYEQVGYVASSFEADNDYEDDAGLWISEHLTCTSEISDFEFHADHSMTTTQDEPESPFVAIVQESLEVSSSNLLSGDNQDDNWTLAPTYKDKRSIQDEWNSLILNALS